MNKMYKHPVAAALVVLMSGCGGGGSDAGTSPFGPNDGNNGSPVSTAVASQSKMSYAVDQYALDWLDFDAEANITIRIADTAGNPLPAGTKVYFVAEAGTVESSCSLVGRTTSGGEEISECSVKFSPLANLPLDGYATVLAYLEGEEAYLDQDGNRRYTSGEPYFEGGAMFRDDDSSGSYDVGVDNFLISSGPGIGSSACRQDSGIFSNPSITPFSKDGTCDGKWGKTYVRAQIRFPISSNLSVGVEDGGTDSNGVRYVTSYSEALGSNPVRKVAPVAGATLTATTNAAGCTVDVSNSPVPSNLISPFDHALIPSGTCAGATVTVTIDSNGTLASTNITL